MYNKYKFRSAGRSADTRLRRQIATEAARQILSRGRALAEPIELETLPTSELAVAKRQAVSILGQRVREADLPTDAEVRAQIQALRDLPQGEAGNATVAEDSSLARIDEHLSRFAIYKLRLEPLQNVRLNPALHPEGDALYHVLQVFDHARQSAPCDEELLLAALLHEVGRAIDPGDRIRAALTALAGTITERTAWLIEHLPEMLPRPNHPPPSRPPQSLRSHPFFDDLRLLAECDIAGREPGAPVPSVDEALEYIQSLEETNWDVGEPQQ